MHICLPLVSSAGGTTPPESCWLHCYFNGEKKTPQIEVDPPTTDKERWRSVSTRKQCPAPDHHLFVVRNRHLSSRGDVALHVTISSAI
eukprot:1151760-Pelagomonas_calceolata.AAC.5